MEKFEEKVQIQLSLPADFSFLLDREIIDLKEIGVKTTKADLCIKLMRAGYRHEKINKK